MNNEDKLGDVPKTEPALSEAIGPKTDAALPPSPIAIAEKKSELLYRRAERMLQRANAAKERMKTDLAEYWYERSSCVLMRANELNEKGL